MSLAWRLARRELRSGVRGFRIFLACLALGVAAIAAAGSTAEAFRQGLASQAREILGGDLSAALEQRRFTDQERAGLRALGEVDYSVSARAMAEAPGGERRLVDLRGVTDNYPLAGRVQLQGARDLAQAFAAEDGTPGVAVEAPLLDRLHLKLGERFKVGNLTVIARAVLVSEPDRLSRGFALGPRVIARLNTVESGGFLSPGLPFGETARIALPPASDLNRAQGDLRRALNLGADSGGFRLRDRNHAAPGADRLIDELEYFLGFIGLASLVAGGLGVHGAVSAYLESKTASIAVLKALGAEGALARDVYLLQIALLAALGVAMGLVIGAVVPLVLGAVIKDQLPVPALFAVYPWPLIKAGAFGLLSAAAFSLAPLAQARVTPPAALFRRAAPARAHLGPEWIAAGVAALGLAVLAVATAPTLSAAGAMIAGVSIAFALLWLMGRRVALAAAALRSRARGPARIGLANLAGPGSAARTATPAIGLGIALLATIVLIQSSLLFQVTEIAPRTAPALIFTDIPHDSAPAFDRAAAAAFGRALSPDDYLRAPFATGRIVSVRGVPVDRGRIDPSDRWAYDNDITLSALGPEPRSAGVVSGTWWPADYAGPPLAAVSLDAARGARLKVGDAIGLSVLGRTLEARVAVLRKVDVGGFGASFPIVLTPSSLAGADLSDVAIAKASRSEEARAIKALGVSYPAVNVISVREQLEAAGDLFNRLSLAIRGAGAVAALAGLLVLAGAIAAGARARAREAALLKVLGADRGQILLAYTLEYGAVGLAAGLAGVLLGYGAAWPVVVNVFKAHWRVDWAGAAGLAAGVAVVSALGGWLAAVAALSRRPAPVLREG